MVKSFSAPAIPMIPENQMVINKILGLPAKIVTISTYHFYSIIL